MKKSIRFLAPDQIRQLAEMAEQARLALSRFAGYEVLYEATTLQLLDEWVDRHLRQFPEPSQRVRLLWTSFLGEMFRRQHGGEWAFKKPGSGLIILCPTGGSGVQEVDVSGQVSRRVEEGITASFTYFFTVASIELKAAQ